MVNYWAKVKSNTFHFRLLWLLFGQLFEIFGLLFKLASGHCLSENTDLFCKKSITVRLTSCLTGLDSTKQVNLLLFQHMQSS